jgi:hypothetical protein
MRSNVSRRWGAAGFALAFLALVSCGGGGGGGGGTPPAPESKLFISDGGGHAIASIINAAPTVNSTFSVDRAISGSATGLGLPGGTPSPSSIPSIALDAANNRLFAATQGSVSVFDNASTANGNVPFSRRITATVITDGVTLRGVNFFSLALDTAGNMLYAAGPAAGLDNIEVNVFNNASTRNGATTPNRTLTPNSGAQIITTFGVAVDTALDKLYVGAIPSGAAQFIMVFDGASGLNTNTVPNNSRAPDRTITLQGAGAFHLDQANDRLYVSYFNGIIRVFNSASTLNGTLTTGDRTIDLAGGFALFQIQHFIFVDTTRNKLYAVGNEGNGTTSVVWIIDNASTANDNGGPASDGVGVEVSATGIRLSGVAVKP